MNSVSGGCISSALKLKTKTGEDYFLKLNDLPSSLPALLRRSTSQRLAGHAYMPPKAGDMFLKEANGLRELRKAGSLRVSQVILAEESFILLEYIRQGSRHPKFFEDFGRRFAEMHKFTSPSFGFFEDNYIGSTIQENIPDENERNNWTDFYWNKRIIFQFRLAERNGYAEKELKDGIKKLENKIEKILAGSEEKPSLLHGDLWSGNFMTDESGSACVIDPAVYYGHREADLAMTKLFGGFDSSFYSAYNEHYPLKDGWQYRENIYKLYHVLNHLNLFGRGYYQQAVSLIRSYL